jgi:hypothetical protein
MKNLITISVFLSLISAISFSQQVESVNKNKEFKTLLGHNNPGGAYGALTAGYSVIDQKQALLLGGKFEWIACHSLGIGFGATGFINEYHFEPALNNDVFLTGGYAGLIVEPILMPNYPVHLSFPVLFGAGGISYVTKKTEFDHNTVHESEAFLLIEPAAEIELNLTRHFRLALGASYRFTTPFNVGMEESSIRSSGSLEGISYMITLKFGKF